MSLSPRRRLLKMLHLHDLGDLKASCKAIGLCFVGAMVVAASASSTISGLDREFPLLDQGIKTHGSQTAVPPPSSHRSPILEILFVVAVLLIAAIFSLKFGR